MNSLQKDMHRHQVARRYTYLCEHQLESRSLSKPKPSPWIPCSPKRSEPPWSPNHLCKFIKHSRQCRPAVLVLLLYNNLVHEWMLLGEGQSLLERLL